MSDDPILDQVTEALKEQVLVTIPERAPNWIRNRSEDGSEILGRHPNWEARNGGHAPVYVDE